ncbi:MAG TPA: hypothetical protein VN539_06960 [Candidatus Saccharimonadales bacterium]|nr:hypothetical protein [Candidatus Saccharimonadales bacterium]
MTFIDWSDAEGMIELFHEFVRDELNGCVADAERRAFLRQLLGDVMSIHETKLVDGIEQLRALQDAIPDEFRADPACTHLADLIVELEGLA